MKTKIQLIVGIVSLVTLLVYTLAHTGGLLSQYVKPAFIGYIAAFGIESAIVSLSLRIGDLRKSQQSTKFFYFVLLSTVVVSAIANTAEGFLTSEGVKLTLSTVARLDIVQAVIGLTATGLISLIVLALSEIVGTDVNAAVKLIDKPTVKRVSITEEINTFPVDIEQARTAKAEQDNVNRNQRLDTLVNTLRDKPDTGPSQLAELLNVSRQTVYKDLTELVNAGTLHKNGNGYEVTQ